MARTPRTYNEIATRLAFLSLSDSPEAKVKADAIVWTLRNVGLSDEKVQEVLTKAEQLAADAE